MAVLVGVDVEAVAVGVVVCPVLLVLWPMVSEVQCSTEQHHGQHLQVRQSRHGAQTGKTYRHNTGAGRDI